MRFPFLNNSLLIYKIIAFLYEQKVSKKENCFYALMEWANRF